MMFFRPEKKAKGVKNGRVPEPITIPAEKVLHGGWIWKGLGYGNGRARRKRRTRQVFTWKKKKYR